MELKKSICFTPLFSTSLVSFAVWEVWFPISGFHIVHLRCLFRAPALALLPMKSTSVVTLSLSSAGVSILNHVAHTARA